MAKCINKIINENVAASGVKNATDKNVANNKSKGDEFLFDTFVDALESATLKLQRTNCTDVVMDYFSNQFPTTTGAVRGGYDWVSENVNLQTGMQKVGGALDKVSSDVGFDSESITSSFCVTVTNAYRTVIFYVDAATKAAFVLFKKIDILKRKLEKALLDFTSEVRDCIVSVIVDAKLAINKVINNITDFDILIELMEKCPCIQDIVSSMFDCTEDEYGNKYTTAAQVVACVETKFLISPDEILSAVNDFVDNTILDNIDKGFNMLDKFIKTTMDLLMAPLRELMRMYCILLNEKINVTSIVKTLGPADCLLVYTVERDERGNEYFGMSVIDIINTFKYWANCFEFVCETFVEDLRTTIKTLNEDLRLDDKYWRDVMLIDLYQSCIAQQVQSQQPRPAMIREIFVKNQDKGKNIFVGIIDAFKQTGKLDATKNQSTKNPTPIADAIQFKDGPDNEDLPIQEGEELFKDATVEESIISIIRNLGTSVNRGIYFERFLQLVEWEARYKKTTEHTNLIEKVDKISKDGIGNIISTREVTNIYDDTSSERVVDAFTLANNPPVQSFKTPTYELYNDYDEESIDKIQESTKPDKLTGESLQSQYTRWYTEVLI
jgi:hypothetical protein